MCLFKRIVYQHRIVERTAEINDGRVDEYVSVGNGGFECQTIEAAAAWQSYVGLTTCKGSTPHVDNHIVECQPLAFMHSERPS